MPRHAARLEVLEDRRLLAIDFALLSQQFGTRMNAVETSLHATVQSASELPIFGSVGSLATVLASNVAPVVAGFGSLAGLLDAQYPGGTATDEQIADLVREVLLPLVGDRDGSGSPTPGDVIVLPGATPTSPWQFEFLVQQELTALAVQPAMDFQFGPHFRIDVPGAANARVGLDYLVSFTFDPVQGAVALQPTSLRTNFNDSSWPDASLQLSLIAAPTFNAAGRLNGLLEVALSDVNVATQGRIAATVGTTGSVSANLSVDASAQAHLSAKFGTGDLPFNPVIHANFHAVAQVIEQPLIGAATPFAGWTSIGFDNVSLDVGSVFPGFVRDIIGTVQDFTKPLQPLIDIINTPVPGLDELGLHLSLRSLIELQGGSGVLAAIDSVDAINSIDPAVFGGTGSLQIGGFQIDTAVLQSEGPRVLTSTVSSDLADQIAMIGGQQYADMKEHAIGLRFPIIDDPLQSVFPMLMGQDATLFAFAPPTFEFPMTLEIPILAIPPLAGLFLEASLAVNLSVSVGYDTVGLRRFVEHEANDVTDPDLLAKAILDGFYIDNTLAVPSPVDTQGVPYDHYATSVELFGGLALTAKAVIVKISGGLYAMVSLHFDPELEDENHYVRLGALADTLGQGLSPFAASGSIYVSADFKIVIPTYLGDITLAHINLAHIELISFNTAAATVIENAGNTIFLRKRDADERIYVHMVDVDTPVSGDPKAFTRYIQVDYSHSKERYPVARYHHDSDGTLVATPLGHYDLIATVQDVEYDIFGNSYTHPETGNKTIVVGDLQGNALGAPVNVVLIGGSGQDVLEYQGGGSALLIGGAGDDKLRSANALAAQVIQFGDSIPAGAFDVATIAFAMPATIQNRVLAHVVQPIDPPVLTSNVLIGAGPDVQLYGGGWDNFFMGSAAAKYVGGQGENEFKIKLSLSDPLAPGAQGAILAHPNGSNDLILDRTGVSGIDDYVQLRAQGSNLHISGYLTDITVPTTFRMAVNMNGGTLDIGDLSPLGTFAILVNRGDAAWQPTHVVVDGTAMQSGPIVLQPFGPVDPEQNAHLMSLNVLHGYQGNLPGANLELLGFQESDVLELKVRQGQLVIGDVSATGLGTIIVDGRGRAALAPGLESTITVPTGTIALTPQPNGDNTLSVNDSYQIVLKGAIPTDSLTLRLTTEDVASTALLDAGQLVGALEVRVLEPTDAAGSVEVTLSAVNPSLDVSIFGATSGTHAAIATGALASIRNDVYVTRAAVTVDNKNSPQGQNFLLRELFPLGSHLTGWAVPGSSYEPLLRFGTLYGDLTINAARGDRFDVAGTPLGVQRVAFHNPTDTQNEVYARRASADFLVDGNWSVYLGQQLFPDGSVARVKHLVDLPIAVTVDFAGPQPSRIVLDGDLDPVGAQYNLGTGVQSGYLRATNQTVGLRVEVSGYRDEDELHIHLPGGTVVGGLTNTPRGTIVVDGRARLEGTHAEAVNLIRLWSRYTDITITPTGNQETLAHLYNRAYVRGSMPQDSFYITLPTVGGSGRYEVAVDGSELRGRLEIAVPERDLAPFIDYLNQERQLALMEQRPVDPNIALVVPEVHVGVSRVRPDLHVVVVGPQTYDAPLLVRNTFSISDAGIDFRFHEFLLHVTRNRQVAASFLQAEFTQNNWRIDWEPTEVTIGDGDLSRIEGDVSVQYASVKVDNRSNSQSAILSLSATQLTGWSTPSGAHPSLNFGTVHGELAINGSPLDRFAVEDTPRHWWDSNIALAESAWAPSDITYHFHGHSYDDMNFAADRVVIRNFATGGPPTDVYVMGKGMMPLEVTGNFSLYVGRRLHPNGSVEHVGSVEDVIAAPAGSQKFWYGVFKTRSQPVFYDFRGQGLGMAVWDASQDEVSPESRNRLGWTSSAGNGGYYGVAHSDLNPERATFQYLLPELALTDAVDVFGRRSTRDLRGQLIYGANTEFHFQAPALREMDGLSWYGGAFNNPVTGPLYYYENLDSEDTGWIPQLTIGNTNGPVYVYGKPGLTHVELNPRSLLHHHAPGGDSSSQADMSRGHHLVDTIRADIYITGASLHVAPSDKSTFPNPPSPSSAPEIVITRNAIQGVTGSIIYLGDLADNQHYYPNGFPTPVYSTPSAHAIGAYQSGLFLELPKYATSIRVEDTQPGITTALDVAVTGALSPVHVVGTTGNLVLGRHLPATEVRVGDGTLENIHGPIFVWTSTYDPQIVLDAQWDAPRHIVSTYLPFGQTEVHNSYGAKMTGIAPAPIYFRNDFSGGVDILASAGSQLDFGYAGYDYQNSWRVFAGPESAVNVFYVPMQGDTPTLDVYGAQSLYVAVANLYGSQYVPLRILPHPDRPADATDATLDFSYHPGPGVTRHLRLHEAGGPDNLVTLEHLFIGSFATSTIGFVQFPFDTTHVTLIGGQTTHTLIGPNTDNEWHVDALGGGTLNGEIAITGFGNLRGGTGSDTLYGPDAPSSWVIHATDGGTLNGATTFADIQHLVGGTADDSFFFQNAGFVTGNIDGGPGVDTLYYLPGVLVGGETIDLSSGIAPRVGGLALRLEAVEQLTTMPSLIVHNPGGQGAHVGAPVAPLAIRTSQGLGAKTFSATNLPPGLSIHPQTGVISGTVNPTVTPGTNYNVTVHVSDLTGTVNASFAWTMYAQTDFFLSNPGNQLSPEGVPLYLPIQIGDLQGRELTFTATGLPSFLSIHPQTGVITGSIFHYFQTYGQTFTFSVQVRATDGLVTRQVNFNWTTQPGFHTSLPSVRWDTAGATVEIETVSSPYGHDLQVTVENLPPGLSINANNQIVGTIDALAFVDSPYAVQVNVTNQTIGYTHSWTTHWEVQSGFQLSPPGDQTSYVGMALELWPSAYNPFDHQVEYQAFGLPPGLSIDPTTGQITGTILASAVAGSPYEVTIVAFDYTVNYPLEVSFTWNVLPELSHHELNAGTPAGVPFLAGILNPMEHPWPNQLRAVTYAHLPDSPTIVYFISTNRLWQFDGNDIAPVTSFDPAEPGPVGATGPIVLPGRGLLFTDDNLETWFVDTGGARRLINETISLTYLPAVGFGDDVYVPAYNTVDWSLLLWRIDVDAMGTATAQRAGPAHLVNIQNVAPFVDGLVFTASTMEALESDALYWFHPATGATVLIDTMDSPFPSWPATGFSDVQTIADANGADMLLYLKSTAAGTQWRAISSLELGSEAPQTTLLTQFDDVVEVGSNYVSGPVRVVDSYATVISVGYYGLDGFQTRVWLTDGTPEGTGPVGDVFPSWHAARDLTPLAGEFYFWHRIEPSEVTELTVVSQLFKLDPAARDLSSALDLRGLDHYYTPPSDLVPADDQGFYFQAWDANSATSRLWHFTPATTEVTLVPEKPGNPYHIGDLGEAFYRDGVLVFVARADAVRNQWDEPTAQVWLLGPAVPSSEGTEGDLDGDGVVDANDIDLLYTLIQSGNLAADLNRDGVVDQADVEYLVRNLLNTEFGDANLDGFVDASDLGTTRFQLGATFDGPSWSMGDFNGDGIVDAADLAIIRRYIGFERSTAAALPKINMEETISSDVPEFARPESEEMPFDATDAVVGRLVDEVMASGASFDETAIAPLTDARPALLVQDDARGTSLKGRLAPHAIVWLIDRALSDLRAAATPTLDQPFENLVNSLSKTQARIRSRS